MKEIKHFLPSHHVTICALLETRVKPHNKMKMQKKLGDKWSWVCKYDASHRGIIWLDWVKSEARVVIKLTLEQLIIVEVQTSSGAHLFHFVVVYGLHTIQDMKTL